MPSYISTKPAPTHKPASPLLVSAPSGLIAPPFRAALESQDTIWNGARLLFVQHTGGSAEWLANAATGGASQANPDAVTWRVVGRGKAVLSAGGVLQHRALAARSGASEEFVPSLWAFKSKQATSRIEIDYERYSPPDTEDDTAQVGLLPSEDDDGLEDTTAGSGWQLLEHYNTFWVRPTPDNTSALLEPWSEWPTLTFTAAHRGGVRMFWQSLSERDGGDHVVAHDVTSATSMHGYSDVQGSEHPTAYPQTKAATGDAYDENRFGTDRGLYVAERQTQRMGPQIANWSSYAERTTEVSDTEADPFSTGSTSWVGISDPDSTGYDADGAGWDFPTHWHRPAPNNLEGRLGNNAAVVPVRAWVYARFTTDLATETGYVRFSTSERSSLTIEIPEESTWAWYTATGWLEGPVNQLDDYALLQDHAKVTGGTMEIRAWSIGFGEFPVAT